MNLSDCAGRTPTVTAKNLPYGLQRRLEIARALATEPKLLLLDEPTAGMNPNETLNLTDFIQRLRKELGLTILLIEHHMRVVMGIQIGFLCSIMAKRSPKAVRLRSRKSDAIEEQEPC